MQSSFQTHVNDGNHNSSNDDDTDSSSSQPDEEEQNWIPWFCSTKGNEFFCEVERAFIEDSFNLFGIKQDFPFDISLSLAIILDKAEYEEENSHEQGRAAELLYGMIHARYLLSSQGLIAMHRKFVAKGFGECPRTCCNGQAALPVGLSDEVGTTPIKLFCPRCRDIYNCPTQRHVDGAFFGTTFPHLFLMTFENLVPAAPTHHYVPRVFGFRIHHTSPSIAKVDSGGRLQHLSLPSSHSHPPSQSHAQPLMLQSTSQPLSVSEVGAATAAGMMETNSTSRDDGNTARLVNTRNTNSSNSNIRSMISSSHASASAMEVDGGDEEVARVEQERLTQPSRSNTLTTSTLRSTRSRSSNDNNSTNNSSSINNNNHSNTAVSSSSRIGNNNNNNLQILSEVSATQDQQQQQQQQQQQPAQKKARKS